MATVVDHIARLRVVAGPGAVLGRRVGHGPRRRAGRPRLRRAGLRRAAGETDINLVTATLRQAQLAVDPVRRPGLGADRLGDARRHRPGRAGRRRAGQRVPARLGARASSPRPARRGPGHRCAAGSTASTCPTGLAIDTELRWSLLSTLVAHGAAGPAEIEAELDRDRTASGERAAALARALVPTAESKAETWRRLTGDEKLPNWLQRSLLQGFQHPSQLALTEPYVPKFFDVVDEVWATRDSEPAQEFVLFGYPASTSSQDTVDATDAWLAVEGHPAPLRRLVAEGKDGVVRATASPRQGRHRR